MKKISVTLFFILFCLTLAAGAQTRWLHDFEGTVGTAKIGLTLSSTETGKFERGDDVGCSYFYVSQLKDIALKCSIDRNGNFTFKELDERGKTRAVFKGKFLQNQIDRAEGTWTRAGEARSLPFKMRFFQGVGAENGNRYAQIEAKDPAKFEAMVRDFRSAVISGNKQKAVAQIKYPISVSVDGKRVRVRTKAAMLTYYDRVFTKEFIADLSKTVPHNMFAKYTGAMLGSGIIWFWGDGKVIAINN
jgi:hypothetical protein